MVPTYDPHAWQDAIERDDTRGVIECVNQGADPDAILPGLLLTPLMLACSRGQVDMVRTLLDLGANVDLPRRETGITPLMAAIHGAQPDMVELLCQRGAQVNLLDQDGVSALGLAVASQHVDIVAILLSHHANPALHGPTSKSALAQACHHGDRMIVSMLLQAGAPVDPRGSHGQDSALIEAADAGHADIVEMLLDRKAKIDQRDANANTPLMLAAAMGHSSVVRLLIARGANPNCTNKAGQSAFHYALNAAGQDGEAIALSLMPFIRLEQPTSKGQTPLFACIQSGHHRLVQQLIERGANVRHTDNNSATALHEAARAGEVDMVRLLLGKGASAEAVDNKGRTALHVACKQGCVEAARLLIGQGQVDMIDRFGNTPLMLAASQGENHTGMLLLEHGASSKEQNSGGGAQHWAAVGGADVLACALMARDGLDESFNECGRAPLHEAAAHNQVRMGVLFTLSGADIALRTRDGLGVQDLGTAEFLQAIHEALANRQSDELQSSTPHAPAAPGRNRF